MPRPKVVRRASVVLFKPAQSVDMERGGTPPPMYLHSPVRKSSFFPEGRESPTLAPTTNATAAATHGPVVGLASLPPSALHFAHTNPMVWAVSQRTPAPAPARPSPRPQPTRASEVQEARPGASVGGAPVQPQDPYADLDLAAHPDGPPPLRVEVAGGAAEGSVAALPRGVPLEERLQNRQDRVRRVSHTGPPGELGEVCVWVPFTTPIVLCAHCPARAWCADA